MTDSILPGDCAPDRQESTSKLVDLHERRRERDPLGYVRAELEAMGTRLDASLRRLRALEKWDGVGTVPTGDPDVPA